MIKKTSMSLRDSCTLFDCSDAPLSSYRVLFFNKALPATHLAIWFTLTGIVYVSARKPK